MRVLELKAAANLAHEEISEMASLSNSLMPQKLRDLAEALTEIIALRAEVEKAERRFADSQLSPNSSSAGYAKIRVPPGRVRRGSAIRPGTRRQVRSVLASR